ncbi:M23 family metallopeptidase [Spirillospora sp. NPDC047279]|uniref:M23 family metallopeptidase n=1 Tax=Spirillospora sp. NPDC047279 TaxID=3155478 RepID=UPI00340A75AE
MKITRKPAVLIGGTVAAAGLVATGVGFAASTGGSESPAKPATQVAASAAAMPRLQMPFPCGQTWRGSSGSGAHTKYEIDFNWGSSGEADNGKTVVSSAAGKVVRSFYSTTSGYGNVIYVQHSGGYTTVYAHLKVRSVKAGQTVKKGQKIGTVGRSSAKYNIISHLHYEVRRSPDAYPPIAVYFEGKRFPYPGGSLKSCGGGGTPTSPVAKICGKGFKQIDKHALGKAATVYLGYSSASKGTNCVITVKKAGAKVKMSATLQGKGGKAKSDAGNFTTYAGPVKTANLGNKCVRWGGSIGSTKWLSGYGHCG